MKLVETVLYSGVFFLFIYVVVSVGLRLFELTTDYDSHMIGGIAATFLGIGMFLFLLLRKNKQA